MKLFSIALFILSIGFVKSLTIDNNYQGKQIPLGSSSDVIAAGPDGLTDYTVGEFSLLELHKNLVSIPSVSQNELAVAKYLSKFLQKAGLTVELLKVPSNDKQGAPRYNVYAYPGETRDTDVLITSHIDTVPPYIPYHIEGSKIFGRGTCDAKGSVASQIFAVLSLLENGELKEGEISLLYVVGEEADGSGMRQASSELGATWGQPFSVSQLN